MTDFKTVFSVSHFTRHLNDTLRNHFRGVKIQGEVASFTKASSGHWYFGLKDEQAQIKAVMFRPRNVLVGFLPKMGDQLEVFAQVGVYEPRGELQVIVETLRLAGQGNLYEQFLLLKDRLSKEGLFDSSIKKPLPRFVFRVGVVTSLQAAALADIRQALVRRSGHVQFVIHHTPVQGDSAVPLIVRALGEADQQGYDAIILARGGGSLEDLWCFNHEAVVRAVAACQTPIVVGVGHESDVTLAEFAADLRAATPTAAAEMVSPSTAELFRLIEQYQSRLLLHTQRHLERSSQRVDGAELGLVTPSAYVQGLENKVLVCQKHMVRTLNEKTRQEAKCIQDCEQDLRTVSSRKIYEADLLLAQCSTALVRNKTNRLLQIEANLSTLQSVIEVLSPQRTLEKGYAFLHTPPAKGKAGSGDVINSVRHLSEGMRVDATLADGDVQLEVRQKK